MKKLMFAAAIIGSTLMSSAASANKYIDPGLEKDLVKVCEALKSNSRIKLLKAVKNSRLTYKSIAKGLVCNGQNALEFAMLNSADKTASLLANKTSVDLNSYLAKTDK